MCKCATGGGVLKRPRRARRRTRPVRGVPAFRDSPPGDVEPSEQRGAAVIFIFKNLFLRARRDEIARHAFLNDVKKKTENAIYTPTAAALHTRTRIVMFRNDFRRRRGRRHKCFTNVTPGDSTPTTRVIIHYVMTAFVRFTRNRAFPGK